MQVAFREPFDLVQGPLYRVDVIRRGADDHLLVLAIHHAIADGWTLGAFVHDLCAAHALTTDGQVRWTSSCPALLQRMGRCRARLLAAELKLISAFLFGRSHLAGAQRLWTDPVDSHTMAAPLQRLVSLVPANLGRAARELARRHGVTLFSTLLTVFRIVFVTLDGRHGHRRRHSGCESKQASRARDDGLLFGHRSTSRTRRERSAILRQLAHCASGIDRLLRECDPICRTHARTRRSAVAGAYPDFRCALCLAESPCPICRGSRDGIQTQNAFHWHGPFPSRLRNY